MGLARFPSDSPMSPVTAARPWEPCRRRHACHQGSGTGGRWERRQVRHGRAPQAARGPNGRGLQQADRSQHPFRRALAPVQPWRRDRIPQHDRTTMERQPWCRAVVVLEPRPTVRRPDERRPRSSRERPRSRHIPRRRHLHDPRVHPRAQNER